MEIKLSDDLLDEMIYVIFDIDYDEENKHRLSVGNKLTNGIFDFNKDEVKWLLWEIYHSRTKDTWTKKMKDEGNKILDNN